jgi:hypothetical protein
MPQEQMSSSSRNGRSPQYIGAGITSVGYSFTPGPINGSIALSNCAQSGSPTVYTCMVGVPANTYALTVTLNAGATVIGTGSASNVAVAPSTSTPVSINITPVLGGPAIALSGSPTQFYIDGHAQTVTASMNELDPIGNVITTYYGPVSNFPTLTLTDSGGTTGVTLNAGTTTFSTVPATQHGGIAATIAYSGAANTSSLALQVGDGAHNSSVSIPFLSLTNSAAGNVVPNEVIFGGIGAGHTVTVTVTESATTGGAATLDTGVTGVTTCSPTDVTFSPSVTGVTNPMTAGVVNYIATANDSSFTSCTLTATSNNDSNLSTTVTFLPSGSAQVGIH